MTIARAHLVDPAVTRWYHCVTHCVRRAFLLSEGATNRREWIERRLQELAEIFAISIGGFSVMDNHLHVLVRLDLDLANDWSDEEVVRRWARLFPPRDKSRQPMAVSKSWVEWRLQDAQWVATARKRLQSLSPNGAEVNSHGLQPLAASRNDCIFAASTVAPGLEESIWLCPIEDRRKLDSSREGMLQGFSLGNYILLVEYTGRLFRDGKTAISAELSGILERIGSTAESWWSRIERLSKGRLLGRFFASSRARLREVAANLGVHHLANLAACPAR